jgi:eukaryotic-like serine/threonine-protein kinase
MALQAGSRLGPYEVLSLIGAGGMGEVYQARDTRLDRKVALKVLAPELASDVEFRGRFAREAKAISALNHPHICGLYDIGRVHETEYLVLELLEGETLASRIERGPLPLAQVLRFGIEIADALEAAHRHGIVHRDLKPANIMLTPAGTKLLDFGLAKHTVGAAGQALSMLATAPGTGTAQGTIIALQYMAPEQVQGMPADARADIFALGTILYEMATGRRAFKAKTQASLIAKILEHDVPAISTLTPLAPHMFDHVVQACLAKEPGDRWQTAHDVKLELYWIQAQGSRTEPNASAKVPRRRSIWLWCGLAALMGAALAVTALRFWFAQAPLPSVAARLEMTLPTDTRVDSWYDRAEISPDGQRVVFSASVKGRRQLFIRDLGSTAVVGLEDTESAMSPFWSPDSRSVAFFARGQLKRLSVTGGPSRVLAETPTRSEWLPGAAAWTTGTIVFAAEDGSVARVPDTGGTATRVETLPWNAAGNDRFDWPRFLPDGRRFLVSKVDNTGLFVASLDTDGIQRIAEDGSRAVYAAGHLVFLRGDNVFARPFDVTRLVFTGPERLLAAATRSFSVSESGTLVYKRDRIAMAQLTWFDRQGRRTSTVAEPGLYLYVVLSRRGQRATLVRTDRQGLEGNADLWAVDLTSGVLSRLTTNPAMDSDPSWSPDERRVVFTSNRGGIPGVFLKDVNTGAEEPLVVWKQPVTADQWTPDGQFVIFRNLGRAVWAVPLSGDRKPRLLVDTPYIEDEVHVSPDGRWVAYNADESGRWEVYVASFPGFTSKRQISHDGGVQPQWSGDGRELFYLSGDGSMMGLRVTPGPEFAGSQASRLFSARIDPSPFMPQYAVTSDGQRFLGLEPVEGESSPLTFLLNGLDPNAATTPVR